MGVFKLDTILAKVKRLWYTTDWAYKKSTYSLTGTEKRGYFVAQSENVQDQGFGKFWQVWKFECDYPFDVQASDILVIENVDYDVKATNRFTWKTLDRVRCILVKSTNE